MFHSQINICQQQRQNVDHMPLKICEGRILLAELLEFSLCDSNNGGQSDPMAQMAAVR